MLIMILTCCNIVKVVFTGDEVIKAGFEIIYLQSVILFNIIGYARAFNHTHEI